LFLIFYPLSSDSDGTNDWMDGKAGKKASRMINAPSFFGIIPEAGHHLYLDNFETFNQVVLGVVSSVQGLPLEPGLEIGC